MKLKDISINNLRRRKGKVFFLILGLTVGITTVVIGVLSSTYPAIHASKMDPTAALRAL